jgi:hypothetical protein
MRKARFNQVVCRDFHLRSVHYGAASLRCGLTAAVDIYLKGTIVDFYTT